MKLIVFGHIGSDAGYWTYENGHWVHHGGWAVDQVADVSRALTALGQLARLKNPGLADSLSKSLGEFVQKELGAHLGDAGKAGNTVVVINAFA